MRAVAGRFDGFVLSFDLEDWHQLVRRGAGAQDWDVPHPAFERQVRVVLDFLDRIDVKATFFVLGMCARNYPALVSELAERGHEIASHGTAHARVYAQTRDEFRADLEESIAQLEELTGRRPTGYRAPAFSINRDTLWAYDVLAELGFRYDSSQHDSPRIPRRIEGIPGDAYRLRLDSGGELWEFPITVGRIGGRTVPIGGGGYWRVFPRLAAAALAPRRQAGERLPGPLLPSVRVRPQTPPGGPASHGRAEPTPEGGITEPVPEPRPAQDDRATG